MAVTASGAVEAAVNGGRLSVCMAPLYIPLWINPPPPPEKSGSRRNWESKHVLPLSAVGPRVNRYGGPGGEGPAVVR
ncbi:unnamed protein product [Boreogadus saida]